jgi:hypothetical protein
MVRHAIADDGSRVIFTIGNHLYSRDMLTKQTTQLDAAEPEATKGEVEEAVYQTASSDGTRVFFSDEQALTKNSTASREKFKPDLYEYDLNTGKLTDLTVSKTSESANTRGVVLGASEDGTTVYFVANGVLGEGKPGNCAFKAHEPAPPNATCNLYVEQYNLGEQAWEAPKLIAVLSNEDLPNWTNNNTNLEFVTSRVSPNGRFLAFMSERSLTGYNNVDVNSGLPDQEVFRYDHSSGQVICASCNPSGARPTGVFDVRQELNEPSGEGLGLVVDRISAWEGHWLAASLPGWTGAEGQNAFYQSRYLSDSGRLFFNAADALVPADVNGKEDVYQYEANGEGTCHSPSGCVSLISSGKSSRESAFLDASASGNDVFFLTAAPLVPADRDTNYDVYDARVCTETSPCVTSSSSTKSVCTEPEACKGASATAPAFATPATVNPSGSGNVPPGTGEVLHTKVEMTRAQKLARALKACKKLKNKKARLSCEKRARKAFGAKKASKRARHSSRKVHR